MSQIVATLLIFALMWSLRQFEWLEDLGGPLTPATMTVGFILLIAYMAGKISYRLKLPRVTGYMFIGILVGPYVFDLVSKGMTHQLQLINSLALSLIALTAGGELRLRDLKPMWRSLLYTTIFHMIVLWFVFIGFVFLARGWFPFLEGESWKTVLVVGMILGSIAIASSPAVAMAIIGECRSRGFVTEAVLGVTVMKDILVIVLFSVVVTVGQGFIRPDIPVGFQFLLSVFANISISIGVGLLLGLLITLYLRYVNAENTLFLIGVCFLSAEVGLVFHLEPALIALSAGFFMENVLPKRSERLIHAIEQGSLPVYTLFFCLAGAALNLKALQEMWGLALVLVCLRLVALYGSTYLGARLGQAADSMRHFGWLGFVAQAGVSLGLAATITKGFPEWGGALQTLLIAVIAFNQLIGPVGFRYALVWSKETRG